MAPGAGGPGDSLLTMRGGGGDWGLPSLCVREELQTETMGRDLVGKVVRSGEVAVYGGRGGGQVCSSGYGGRFLRRLTQGYGRGGLDSVVFEGVCLSGRGV